MAKVAARGLTLVRKELPQFHQGIALSVPAESTECSATSSRILCRSYLVSLRRES